MISLIDRIKPVLAAYAPRGDVPIEPATALAALGIDSLDLTMITLDIEDLLDLTIPCPTRLESACTLGDVVACIEAAIADKSARVASRAAAPRIKRSWVDTVAEHRA